MLKKIDCVMVYTHHLADAALFYQEVFGLRQIWQDAGAVGLVFPESDTEIVLHTDPDMPSKAEVHYLVADTLEAVNSVRQKRCEVLVEPFDIAIGKCAVIQDPFGTRLCILDMTKGPRPIQSKVKPDIHIRPSQPFDQERVAKLMQELWGEDRVVSHGQEFITSQLPALMAYHQTKFVGLLTYQIRGDTCEVVTINNFGEVRGAGSALIERVKAVAQAQGCKRLFLCTTNDNLEALAFYQKRGFRLIRVCPNAVDEARRLKPSIPLVAGNGIAIRDELELELRLV
jgi:N-acetylglutamate synthase-like GNAT family acetyltransferase/predicted enzyme related to lactoylglutathione lyase